MEMVCCQGLGKTYGAGPGAVRALRGLDLTVSQGAFVAIVGASGSGKSTLAHLLAAVDSPTEGKVYVDGTDLGGLKPKAAAVFRRRRVGMIYQFYNLLPTLTVRQNIRMPMLLDRKTPDDGYLARLADTLGITDKLDVLPGQLSGGQQQRAAVARALLYRPALLVADEPTGNLDRENSRALMALLKELNRSLGQTLVLITHDELVAAEADRIVTLEDGRLLRDSAAR